MGAELKEAIRSLEKEKGISRESLIEAIEQSLIQACKNHFGKADNIVINMDPETCDYEVYANKEVVEDVEDPVLQMSLLDAKKIDEKYEIGDTVRIPIQSREFGRIATKNAKNVILQKIREEERRSIYNRYYQSEHTIVSGIVQKNNGKTVVINLGRADGILTEAEMIRGENLRPQQRIKVYVTEVKDTPKGPRILVSRSNAELVKRLFEAEVEEIRDGTVEIVSIAREAG